MVSSQAVISAAVMITPRARITIIHTPLSINPSPRLSEQISFAFMIAEFFAVFTLFTMFLNNFLILIFSLIVFNFVFRLLLKLNFFTHSRHITPLKENIKKRAPETKHVFFVKYLIFKNLNSV